MQQINYHYASIIVCDVWATEIHWFVNQRDFVRNMRAFNT